MGDVIINLNPNNAQEIEEFLNNLSPEIEVDLLELYKEGGELITDRASARAPKKTGFMAAMIGFSLIEHGITIVGGAPYTSFQEFGTFEIAAKYFITDSIDEIMPMVDDEAERIVDEYLRIKADEINSIPFEPIDFMGI